MLTRDNLERMKRVELQSLCKSYGIRANLKSEQLVELLLKTSLTPEHVTPPPLPPVRLVSDRTTARPRNTRSRLYSHHTDHVRPRIVQDALSRETQLLPPPRTTLSSERSGRAPERRVDHARPDSGRRAAAKIKDSNSVAGKNRANARAPKRIGKLNRDGSIKESTVDPSCRLGVVSATCSPTLEDPSSVAGPSKPRNSLSLPPPSASIQTALPLDWRSMLRAVVDEQVQPLLNTVGSLRAEIDEQAASHREELSALSIRVDLLSKQIEGLILQSESYGAVQTAVDSLRSELDSLRHHSDSLGTPRAGQATRSPRLAEPTLRSKLQGDTDLSRTIRASHRFEYPPPPSTKKQSKDSGYFALGKRTRAWEDGEPPDLSTGDVYEDIEGGQRTSRKRPRLESSEPPRSSASASSMRPGSQGRASAEPPRTRINVYAGPEETGAHSLNEPITESDFDYFDEPADLAIRPPVTRSAHATENQRVAFPFPGFVQNGGTSTPITNGPPANDPSDDSPVVNNFPFPQVPHSPSPAPLHASTARSDRADHLRPLAAPPAPTSPLATPLRRERAHSSSPVPISITDTTWHGTIRTPQPNQVISDRVNTTQGTSLLRTPVGLSRRTLYGTELEGDTRFGDFGFDWGQ